MNYEDEVKKCLLEKDIFALQAAKMDQKKVILEGQKRISEAKSRIEEYEAQIKQRQDSLATLEG